MVIKHKQALSVLVVVTTLYILYITSTYHKNTSLAWGTVIRYTTKWHGILCGEDKLTTLPRRTLTYPIMMRDLTPDRMDSNIFLIDSACNTHPKYRALCAVESWAIHNPGFDVWFLQTSPFTDDTDSLPSDLLLHYPNLHIVGVDLDALFNNTPLNPLFTSKRWMANSTWPIIHLSDMSRVLALWHWGGIYTDTDIICIKNYTLPLSHVGVEKEGVIGSALLSFTHHHPLLWKLMDYMNSSFKLHVWGSIGPRAATVVVKAACPNGDIRMATAPHSCTNFTVHHPSTFFPYPWTEYKKFLKEGDGKNMDKVLKNSYAFHIYNKMSNNKVMYAGSNSIYDTAAKMSCPITYRQATLRSNTF